MNVLEMEEAESLVPTTRRKLSATSQKQRGTKKCDVVDTCARRSEWVPKVVVVVSFVLLCMIYKSAQSDAGEIVLVETESKIPAPIETSPPTLPPTIPPTTQQQPPPPVDPPTVPPTQQPTEAPKPVDDSEKDAFKYSRYATILPLVDHPLPDETTQTALAETYGKWHFWDGDEDERPLEDYTSSFPHRDIPGDDFPVDAWQADAVYVNHILNDADQLVARAMEAIFTEYGHAKPLPPEGLAARMKMFHWSRENLSELDQPPPPREERGNGGWTTKRSYEGLVRRLLHAMMTQDTFTIVLAGDGAAKGGGNDFRKSYSMQLYKVLVPIFARMGVRLVVRNSAQEGLGTLQGGMGSGSIYGDEVDLLLWDAGSTENDPAHVDMFYRQALLAGNRIPVLWGGPFELLKMLHEEADVDVGDWGTAMDGIPEIESAEQAKDVPWAARFLKCKPEAEKLCKDEPRFCASCWKDRENPIGPDPGWREHQLMGRNLAFGILEALQTAINVWSENVMGGPPLDDQFWHVNEYYENIRNKVKNLDKSLGKCYQNDGSLPTRLCNTPMKAKTQYTPRANPSETALTSIVKPASDGSVPKSHSVPTEVSTPNTCFEIPEGEIDVFNVVAGRRRRRQLQKDVPSKSIPETAAMGRELGEDTTIEPGKGWEVSGEPSGDCDGTYNTTCTGPTGDDCAMVGHHDGKGAIVGNEYSGWLVMTLKDVKEGIIVLKLHTWHTEEESTVTKGWTSVNNARGRRLGQKIRQDRTLARNYDPPELPNEFVFEYAIDGAITTLTKDQFLDKKQSQKFMETLTLLDDPKFTTQSKDVEIAIRLRGSKRSIVVGVSHVYWA